MVEIKLTDEEYISFLLNWNNITNVEYDISVRKEFTENGWILRWREYIMYGDDFNGFEKNVYKNTL